MNVPASPNPAARLAALRQSFALAPPGYAQRRATLQALGDMLQRHEQRICAATTADFGGRAHAETQLLELLPLQHQITLARRHLKRWMRRRRVRGSWFLWPAGASYQYQPLGVVGILGAWNYPWQLTLGPAIDAIAAGNHVLIKPSEIAPRSAQLLAELLDELRQQTATQASVASPAAPAPAWPIDCINGDATLAQAFSELPFDHLFFTGSTRVGHQVLQAAARQLTPVTLELGGKSPALIAPGYPIEVAARRLAHAKLLNAGQTCIAPDYLLLPRGCETAFERAYAAAVAALYPTLTDNPDYTRIINTAQYQRLQAALLQARASGARVVNLVPAGAAAEVAEAENRVLPPTLVFDADAGGLLMQQEIFGPVLPVIGYDQWQQAVADIQARSRPLALYCFDHDRPRIEQLLAATLSGGVTVNDCLYHAAQYRLPFGGVGASGIGHYHGFDGFQTFSKKRAIMWQRRFSPAALLRPPYNRPRRQLIRVLLWLARRLT